MGGIALKREKYRVIRISFPLVLAALLLLGLGSFWTHQALTASADAEESVQQLPVIMYHHLSENSTKLGDYTISPTQLESDLKKIQELGYTAISLSQLKSYYEDGTSLPEKSVLLTFDDGYYSVYVYAYPLLQQYQMPATCFILGYYTQMYSDGEKQNVAYAHMTWDQLQEMEDSGLITLGSHSYNLHQLRGQGSRYGISINQGESNQAYCDAVLQDLTELSDAMYLHLGIYPDSFAYPFGAICKQSYSILEQMQFTFAFTCEEKVNQLNPDAQAPILLGRYNRASSYSTDAFFKKLGMSA
jgi:peptidoglycan/xylan/chitin deacetylase (PgdA/CDA1 family)